MKKKETRIEFKFPIEIYIVDDDGYIADKELEITDWNWHDGALRIFIKEST